MDTPQGSRLEDEVKDNRRNTYRKRKRKKERERERERNEEITQKAPGAVS